MVQEGTALNSQIQIKNNPSYEIKGEAEPHIIQGTVIEIDGDPNFKVVDNGMLIGVEFTRDGNGDFLSMIESTDMIVPNFNLDPDVVFAQSAPSSIQIGDTWSNVTLNLSGTAPTIPNTTAVIVEGEGNQLCGFIWINNMLYVMNREEESKVTIQNYNWNTKEWTLDEDLNREPFDPTSEISGTVTGIGVGQNYESTTDTAGELLEESIGFSTQTTGITITGTFLDLFNF